MTLNLNKPEELTLERVRQFIASCDDSADRQIRVTKAGIAFISDTTGAADIEDIAFRLETFDAGSGYFGDDAASDDEWVASIQNVLKKNWPQPSSSYIDAF